MGRSIAGILAGFLYVVAGTMLSDFALGMLTLPSSGDDPTVPPFVWPVRIATAGFFALVGGYVAGTVSKRAERLHALVLGVILAAVFALTAQVALVEEQPPDWFKLAFPALGLVCAVLGGELRFRYRARMAHWQAPRS